MPNDTVRAAAEGVPITHLISRYNLRLLSMKNLIDLYEGVKAMQEMVLGLLNQPRFQANEEENLLNGAGAELDSLLSHFNTFEECIVKVAQDASPKDDPDEVEYRGFLLLHHEVSSRDTLSGISALAAKLADEKASADFHARHGRPA